MDELTEAPKPSNETGNLTYFDEKMYHLQEHMVPGVIMAFERLQKDKLVD